MHSVRTMFQNTTRPLPNAWQRTIVGQCLHKATCPTQACTHRLTAWRSARPTPSRSGEAAEALLLLWQNCAAAVNCTHLHKLCRRHILFRPGVVCFVQVRLVLRVCPGGGRDVGRHLPRGRAAVRAPWCVSSNLPTTLLRVSSGSLSTPACVTF